MSVNKTVRQLTTGGSPLSSEQDEATEQIYKGVENVEAFREYVVTELQQRKIGGSIELKVVSAAKGDKAQRQVFRPIKFVDRFVEVIVQYDGPRTAHFCRINPVDMDYPEAAERFGIPLPSSWSRSQDRAPSDIEPCRSCDAKFREDHIQIVLVEEVVQALTGDGVCTGSMLDLILMLMVGDKAGPTCVQAARTALLDTTCLFEGDNGYGLGRRGQKLYLQLLKQWVAPEALVPAPIRPTVDQFRKEIQEYRQRGNLASREAELSALMDKAQAELSRAEALVASCRKDMEGYRTELTELKGKTGENAVLPDQHQLLQLVDDPEAALKRLLR